MPTVLRNGPYRVFFYVGDGGEPPHVHVARDERVAKFWLSPVRLQKSGGLRRFELLWAEDVSVTEDALGVELSDWRTVWAPLAWYPRLVHRSETERANGN